VNKANPDKLYIFQVYRQDPPKQGKKTSNGDGTFSIEYYATLVPIAIIHAKYSNRWGSAKFHTSHPVLEEITDNTH
jgi:hypothetical protein